MVREYVVPHNTPSQKLSAFLRRQGISATVLKRAKWQPGGLEVNGEAVYSSHMVLPGDRVRLTLTEAQTPALEPENLPMDILAETETYLAVNKPAGQLVHPTGPFRTGTLAAAYLYRAARMGDAPVCRPVGRLDRNTSGVMLLAKDPVAQAALQRGMKKAYFAIAQGLLPENGLFQGPLGFAPGSHVKQAVCPDGRPAATAFHTLAVAGGHSLAAVYPRTGRTHQIRVHFSHGGYPLAGDDFYGGSVALLPRQALHCAAIWLPGTDGPLFCPPPADMQGLAVTLGLAENGFDWRSVLDKTMANGDGE